MKITIQCPDCATKVYGRSKIREPEVSVQEVREQVHNRGRNSGGASARCTEFVGTCP